MKNNQSCFVSSDRFFEFLVTFQPPPPPPPLLVMFHTDKEPEEGEEQGGGGGGLPFNQLAANYRFQWIHSLRSRR